MPRKKTEKVPFVDEQKLLDSLNHFQVYLEKDMQKRGRLYRDITEDYNAKFQDTTRHRTEQQVL